MQFVVGLVLAVVMLAWGLPHFAHTTWADVWHVMSGVPLSTLFALTFLMVAGLWLYTFTFTGSLPGLTHLQAMSAVHRSGTCCLVAAPPASS